MLLCPRENEDIAKVESARDFILSLGFGKVHFTSPEEHDRMIAFTSQLAHIVSNAYVKSPSAPMCRPFAAGSYRDLTRVARLNPTMWTELFLENSDSLSAELDKLIASLTEYSEEMCIRDRFTPEPSLNSPTGLPARRGLPCLLYTSESFEIDLRRDVSLYVISGRGILLMPGHARDRVVEDYHRRGRIVVRYINKPRDSGVHERGVADHADALTRARAAVGFVESVKS